MLLYLTGMPLDKNFRINATRGNLECKWGNVHLPNCWWHFFWISVKRNIIFFSHKTLVVFLCFAVKWITCEQFVPVTAPLLIFLQQFILSPSFVPLSLFLQLQKYKYSNTRLHFSSIISRMSNMTFQTNCSILSSILNLIKHLFPVQLCRFESREFRADKFRESPRQVSYFGRPAPRQVSYFGQLLFLTHSESLNDNNS